MRIGDRLRLRIDSLAFGGEAVGRSDEGRVVFVAGGAPGDLVEADVVEVKKDFARASLAMVLRPGPDRVAPPCPLVDRCGGCPWQHVSLGAQRRAKQEIVARALGRLGVEVAPIDGSTPAFGYRRRTRMSVSFDGQAVGYSGRRSHEVVDVATCPLLRPPLDRAMRKARRTLGGNLSPNASLSGLVSARDEVHLCIEGDRDIRGPARGLLGQAGVRGLEVDGQVVGEATIDIGEAGAPLHAAASGFAQASEEGNRALRALVAAQVAPAERVLEFHAGDGNFTRDLVRLATEVTAVESEPAAVARLQRNVPAALHLTGDAAEEATALSRAKRRFDLVLLDPPRVGAHELLPSLAALTDRIVYVSCDPMTLARDAATLGKLGFAARQAWPVDMMPQTHHVEVVLLLARG